MNGLRNQYHTGLQAGVVLVDILLDVLSKRNESTASKGSDRTVRNGIIQAGAAWSPVRQAVQIARFGNSSTSDGVPL